MTAPHDVSPASAEAASDALLAGAGAIEGRSLGQIAWRRLRRDKVAIAGGVVVVVLVLVALLAPIIVKYFGTPPDQYNPGAVDPNLQTPLGHFGGISLSHPLGVEPQTGRDLFSRILYGAQISLLIASLATVVSVVIGVFFGIVAGYFGGWVDTLISRAMDIFLAFPLLIFAIALGAVVQQKAFGLTGNTLHISVLVFIIGFFNWPYMGRIIRGQALSLREREYVDAARSLGARPGYILFRELLPNLLAAMLAQATIWYQVDPEYLVVPGLAIFITVLAFNLFGDGLRDALDPRGR